MADLVGQRGLGSDESAHAVTMTCLLTVFFTQHTPKALGLRTERELRTIAMALDYLIRGDVLSAMDILSFRSTN